MKNHGRSIDQYLALVLCTIVFHAR
jgi:hypothetical protein